MVTASQRLSHLSRKFTIGVKSAVKTRATNKAMKTGKIFTVPNTMAAMTIVMPMIDQAAMPESRSQLGTDEVFELSKFFES